MKKAMILLNAFLMVLFVSACNNPSQTKVNYELQERCSKSAKAWTEANGQDIADYQCHYNFRLNKCLILIITLPVSGKGLAIHWEKLIDPNENKVLGRLVVHEWLEGRTTYQCFITDEEYVDRTKRAKEALKSGEIMGTKEQEQWISYSKKLMTE